MNHAYSVRIPLSGNAQPSSRLSRMAAQGWTTCQPIAEVEAAYCGAASFCQNDAWFAFGLVFLQDRAAVATDLGVAAPDDTSDLDLMLALRVAHGPDFAQTITGSFSLVLVHRETGAFEAYRDHFGLYPLYYTLRDGALTCASDLRACLHLAGGALVVDPLRVADFLHGEDIDVDRTAFDGLYRLPPAHRLCPDADGVKARRYWQLEMPAPYAGEDGVADLRDALARATTACLRMNGTVGAMLSGGLDSSSLAGLAAQKTPDLQTLSFVYGPDKAYDESPYIDAANEAFQSVAHKIPIEAGVPLDALAPVIEEQMDLFLAPGLPKSRQIYGEAHKLGLAALLDGHGGDEAISHGYGRLVELAAARRFWTLYRESRGAAQVHGVPLIALVAGHIGRYAGLRPRHPLRRVLMKTARMLSRNSLVSNWSGTSEALIAPDLRSTIDMDARYKPAPVLTSRSDFEHAADITHLKSLTDPLIVQSFEVLHRSATQAGVLPFYPFFDRRVISVCLALPSDMKLRDGRSRWVLREAMQGVLPDKIRLRVDKAEFGNELKDTILAFFAKDDPGRFAPLADFVDVEVAEHLRASVLSGAVSDVAAIRALWRLAVLIHWVAAFDRWRDAQNKGMLI